MRPEPNTDTEAIDALPVGSELVVTGAPTDDGEFVWLPVETDTGLTGYVVTDFLELVADDEE